MTFPSLETAITAEGRGDLRKSADDYSCYSVDLRELNPPADKQIIMTMRKRNVFYWLLIGAVVVVPLVVAFVRETIAVSDCRGSGGSYDYVSSACDPTGAAHLQLPFGARHQGLLAFTVMLLFFIAVGKWVTWSRRVGR